MTIYRTPKKEAEKLLRLSISFLRKNGYLGYWKTGTIKWTRYGTEAVIGITTQILTDSPYMRLTYAITGQDGIKKNFDYNVMLTSTPCNFGEKRFWFVCPLTIDGKPCNKRIGVIYKGNDYFGCRNCFNLTYKSKNMNRHSGIFPAISFVDNYQKLMALKENMKRSYYNGLPTKKERKLLLLYRKCLRYTPHKLTYMES